MLHEDTEDTKADTLINPVRRDHWSTPPWLAQAVAAPSEVVVTVFTMLRRLLVCDHEESNVRQAATYVVVRV